MSIASTEIMKTKKQYCLICLNTMQTIPTNANNAIFCANP